MDERDDILALFGVPGVGAKIFSRLVRRFGSAAEVFSASDRSLLDVEGVGPVVLGNLRLHDRSAFIRNQKRLMEKCGADFIVRGGPGYPQLLDVFESAPPVLFVRGNAETLSVESLAFVGTRHPSPWGVSMTRKLVAGAASAGFCTVSGMAAGIDSAAHRTAIELGGGTVAVFGCGVDVIYPSENRELAVSIRTSGCIVSHFPMGTTCSPGNFPARNALIVGLSGATIVVEAPKRSGALITADLALRAKRPLFAVPGNADSPESEGTNALFEKGAWSVSRFDDILRRLKIPGRVTRPAESPQPPETRSMKAAPPGIAGRILDAIKSGPMQFDDLCTRTGMTASSLLTELTVLEMDGYIRQRPGKIFERT
jgi:DNA processing protein